MRDDIPQLFKNQQLSFYPVTGYACHSKIAVMPLPEFSLPSLLLLTPKSIQLFGEVTWKVAKLPTITLVPVWKKLLPSQSESLSQAPHQLLTHT